MRTRLLPWCSTDKRWGNARTISLQSSSSISTSREHQLYRLLDTDSSWQPPDLGTDPGFFSVYLDGGSAFTMTERCSLWSALSAAACCFYRGSFMQVQVRSSTQTDQLHIHYWNPMSFCNKTICKVQLPLSANQKSFFRARVNRKLLTMSYNTLHGNGFPSALWIK